MWFYFTVLILLLLLISYFFIFPLYKKRPVLIKKGGLIIFSLSFVVALFPIFGMWTFIVAVVIELFLYSLNPWFIYGITGIMLSDALEKAALATRAPIEKLTNKYKIDDSIGMKQYDLMNKIILLSFSKIGESKKAKLTLVVFKKFMQNYYI